MSSTHRVVAGETLQRIASRHGFNDWKKVWFHQNNDEFRRRRPNPDILQPGDDIFIPDPPAEELRTGRRHRFIARRSVTTLRLRLEIGNDNPESLAGARFRLDIGGTLVEGSCDMTGSIEAEIPCTEEEGTLTIWLEDDGDETWEIDLRIGHLDPLETTEGIQARLNNLGYHCGDHDGVLGERTDRALLRFRDDHGIRADSSTDPAVIEHLGATYGK